MTGTTHVRYELARAVRNRISFVFSFVMPLAVFYAVASSQRASTMDGIPFAAYYMSGMAGYGALFAAFSPAGRIAVDRARGWARQVRITPLPARSYVVAKALAAYVLALPTLLALDVAGFTLGVSMTVTQWLTMNGLVLLGLLPFVVLAIAVGHLVTPDALAAVVGGLVVFFGLFGGAWGDFFTSGPLQTLVPLLPSYWLVQAGRVVIGGGAWPLQGWLVVLGWTAAMSALAAAAYARDGERV